MGVFFILDLYALKGDWPNDNMLCISNPQFIRVNIFKIERLIQCFAPFLTAFCWSKET